MADRSFELNALVERVRLRTIERVAKSALDGDVVVVKAENADEAIAVAELALRQVPAAAHLSAVDVARCGSTREFAISFARAVVGLYMADSIWLEFPPDSRPGTATRGLMELGVRVGGGLVRLLEREAEIRDADAAEVFSLAVDALTNHPIDHPTVLAFLNADEFVPPARRSRRSLDQVEELLWTLRARLQPVAHPPGLMFVGGDATGELTANDRAAFFGWGTTVALEPVPDLAAALASHLSSHSRVTDDDALGWAAEIERVAEGSVMLAARLAELTILGYLRKGNADRAVDDAWATLLKLSEGALRQTVRSVRAIDRLALPVVVALARGRPPYGVDRFASGPNRALRSLRAAGFVVQREPGKWRLSDPLLAAWLRAPVVHGRYSFGRPTIYVVPREARRFAVTDAPSLTRVRSTHRSLVRAESAARQLASEGIGAHVHVFDTDDLDDLPSWAREEPSPIDQRA